MSWWRQLQAWRGAILGTLIVLGGLCAAIVTWLARRAADWEAVRLGALASMVFVLLMLAFVVPPLVRSARAEAGRFDAPFQLTSGGVIFIGIFLVVAFAAFNTGNNLLFLIFSVLASTLFVAWSAARASLRDLVVSARFPDHIFAGEPAPVIVTLHNTKRLLPSFSILVEARSRLEAGSSRRWQRPSRPRFSKRALAYFMYVPRGARVEQRVEQVFEHRGHDLITGFELSTRFPFGFFRLRRRLRARNVDLIVYPRPEPASDELHLLPVNAGRLASIRRGAGHDLHSLRDYQAQDDMRHIDWKATARTSRLVVREFTSEDERRIHIFFDTRSGVRPSGEEAGGETKRREGERNGGEKNVGERNGSEANETGATGKPTDFTSRFERGVTLAASLVSHFIEERAEVRLTLGEESERYGEGREHLYACLRRLALVVPDIKASTKNEPPEQFWLRVPFAAEDNYVILLTTAPPGSIPSHIWRKSHVIYL
ncbi:MAG TPA: DUF58 domain-containing protein [Pyrinomonadaceae bacterium]|jgi:uncharacterized protein (DUF58 family)